MSGDGDQPMRSSGRSKRAAGSFLSHLSAEIKICGLDLAGALAYPRSLTYNNNNNNNNIIIIRASQSLTSIVQG